MVRQHNPTRDDDLRPGDEIDELLGEANPNPDRVGCPSRETLVELARRARPIDDPAYEHLVKCSPCYREVRAFQEEWATGAASRQKRTRWLVAAAAVLLIALASTWLLTRGPESPSSTPTTPRTQVAEVRTELDLRKYAVLRNDQSAEPIKSVVLPVAVVELTLLLPVGSEPGTYDVQLFDLNLKARAGARAAGRVRNFITTVQATVDLRKLETGPYQLAVRRVGEDWLLFPAELR
jgi:hypothetical protein